MGQSEDQQRALEARKAEELAEMRQRHPGLTIEKHPRDMTAREVTEFQRLAQQSYERQRRDAAPDVAAPPKHPRDMTDAEFKSYQWQWEQTKRAKYG